MTDMQSEIVFSAKILQSVKRQRKNGDHQYYSKEGFGFLGYTIYFMIHVGKYTIHGSYGLGYTGQFMYL